MINRIHIWAKGGLVYSRARLPRLPIKFCIAAASLNDAVDEERGAGAGAGAGAGIAGEETRGVAEYGVA